MLNNTILIGRLVDKPKLVKINSELAVCNLTLAVERPFRDKQNEKVTDFLPVSIWNGSSKYASSFLEKGDIVCLKCRLRQKKQVIENTNIYSVEIIGERIVLIATKSNKKIDESIIRENNGNINTDGLINGINNPDEEYYDDDFDEALDSDK